MTPFHPPSFRSHRLRPVTLLIAMFLLIAACGGGEAGGGDADQTSTSQHSTGTSDGGPSDGGTAAAAGPTTITVLSHDSFSVSEDVMAAFTDATGISVEILAAGDAGSALAQAILTRDNPTADVLFGVDNTFLARALDEELFIPYEATGLDRIAPELQLDPDHRVTPVDFGDVCVNYDKLALAERGVDAPQTLADLASDEFAGDLVVEDPATSSPGLAFLIATIATFGEQGEYTWEDYWADLAANDVIVTSGWDEAYYGSFSGGAGEGDRPLVVSYASSPPAEVLFADPQPDEAPTASMEQGCFRQIEFVGILEGTEKQQAAEAFVDFMISDELQADIPLNMFVWPAVTDTPLPDAFVEYAQLTPDPITMDPATIEASRQTWIETWTDILR